MRICIVYDCLYPFTIGGAERWYRNLAERLASSGHEVTFLTRRQWERGVDPAVAGVRVVAVSPRMELYARGRRRLLPPLVFGLGVLIHLLRHGRRYDVVHTASFPYFSLLAAGLVRKRGAFRIVVDWHEVWTPKYWREYAGRFAGWLGWRIQRACVAVPQRACCFSRLHLVRLREQGFVGQLTLLEGQYAGPPPPEAPGAARPVVVFAGRHIPEKRVTALVPALALARKEIPELRGEIFGEGPERAKVLQAIADCHLAGAVTAPGFVEADVLQEAIGRALCFVLPSEREGYGLVVVEACVRGVPVVVVEGPDNAAVELVDEDVNGVVAASASPAALAAAMLRIHEAGPSLRRSSANWFRKNADRLSFERSFEHLLEIYDGT